MKVTPLFILVALVLTSCFNDKSPEPSVENFKVSINAIIDPLNIVNGRIENDTTVTYTDLYFYLKDSACNDIDSQGTMLNDENPPPVVLPNLPAGKYYYYISLTGSENILYDSASSFIIESDTSLTAHLSNQQFRYRFKETSNFDANDVYYIRYQLNVSTLYRYDYHPCADSATWGIDMIDAYIDNIGYSSSYDTDYYYNYPADLESVQVKFYDQNSVLLKSHIVPLTKELKIHHSYTFEVDLTSIWEGADGSRIDLNIEEVSWVEETIEVN